MLWKARVIPLLQATFLTKVVKQRENRMHRVKGRAVCHGDPGETLQPAGPGPPDEPPRVPELFLTRRLMMLLLKFRSESSYNPIKPFLFQSVSC